MSVSEGSSWREISFSQRRTALSSRPKKAAISFHESRRRSELVATGCPTKSPERTGWVRRGNARLCPFCVRFCPLRGGGKAHKYTSKRGRLKVFISAGSEKGRWLIW